jgi:hypothetical protein
VRQSSDPYKRAVYCVLAACDPQEEHAEIATSLDDYLWLKLCQVCLIFHSSTSIILSVSVSEQDLYWVLVFIGS